MPHRLTARVGSLRFMGAVMRKIASGRQARVRHRRRSALVFRKIALHIAQIAPH
jgi:hypothetical protein